MGTYIGPKDCISESRLKLKIFTIAFFNPLGYYIVTILPAATLPTPQCLVGNWGSQ